MHRLSIAGLLLSLLLAPAALCAQTDEEKELAEKRYRVGAQLYDISQYAKALVEFNEAYRLYPLPDMLFNIARCHEVLGDLEQAIRAYKLFLEKKPDSPHASRVKARLRSLRERLVSKKDEEEPLAEDPAPGGARTWRWAAGWAGVGAGGAAMVTGVILGALASGKSSEHDEARDRGDVYEDLKEIQGTGEKYEAAQIALMVTGGLVMAAGGGLLVWEFLGREGGPAAAGVKLTPVAIKDGVGAAGIVRF